MAVRVLHINTSDRDGGAARAALRLHKGLRDMGTQSVFLAERNLSGDVDVVFPKGKMNRLKVAINSRFERLLWKLLCVKTSHWWSTGYAPFDVISPFLSDASFDVIHLHWINGGFLDIAKLKQIKVPIVWLLHDSWPFTGGCHIPFDCVRYKVGCHDCPELNERARYDIARWVFHRKSKYYPESIHIVAPSRWLADAARASALFSGWDIRVIPNGVDVQRYHPTDRRLARELLGIPQNCKLILFGAMGATSDLNKGFDLLCEAMDRLRTDADFNAHIIIFGSEKPTDSHDFGMPTTYTGRLYDDISLALLYNATDVMVIPSRSESFSNVCLESLASGTPVVAFGIGGLLDLMEHKKTGYLARPYDTGDLAHGIRWVLEDEERLYRLRDAARKRAASMFDMRDVVRRYNGLYEEITSSNVIDR